MNRQKEGPGMEKGERLDYLVSVLARERGMAVPPGGEVERPRLLRALMNLRPPAPIDPETLRDRTILVRGDIGAALKVL